MYYVGQNPLTNKFIKNTLSDMKLDTQLAILAYQIPIARANAKQNHADGKPAATDYPIINIITITDEQIKLINKNTLEILLVKNERL